MLVKVVKVAVCVSHGVAKQHVVEEIFRKFLIVRGVHSVKIGLKILVHHAHLNAVKELVPKMDVKGVPFVAILIPRTKRQQCVTPFVTSTMFRHLVVIV